MSFRITFPTAAFLPVSAALVLALSALTGCVQKRTAGTVECGCTAVSHAPGDTLTEEAVNMLGLDSLFRVSPVPDGIFALMQGKSYKENCTIPRDSLRYLLCLHKDIDGNILVGEMVVSCLVADDLLQIFRELYLQSYPIGKMRLADYYDADDELIMRDNCSSCFNFRQVSNSRTLSRHSRGIAVDINPLYNPFRHTVDGKVIVEPATAEPYADRTADFAYKIEPDDLCVRLFKAHGFTWGGDWKSSKDWQHFER